MFDLIEAEKNVLVADENPATKKLLTEYLEAQYVCDSADSAAAMLEKLRAKDYAVLLCALPLSDCRELLAQIQSVAPHTATILINAADSSDFTAEAFRAGAFDFIRQPFQLLAIDKSVARGFEHYELKLLKERYQFHLEELVAERTTEVDRALEEIENSYRMTLKALVQALETRDFETHGHSERVVTFSLRLGHELGLDKAALRHLELGALLHDIGKIGVPDQILRKPAKLTAEEWDKMKLHPQHGEKILRNIPFLKQAARIVAQHHERWDGGGYPFGLRGEDVDLAARIFAVADAFDAMISDRVYRRGCSYEAARAELERCAGTQFDPHVVEAFGSIPPEDWDRLRERSLNDGQEVFSFQAVVAELVHSRQQFESIH